MIIMIITIITIIIIIIIIIIFLPTCHDGERLEGVEAARRLVCRYNHPQPLRQDCPSHHVDWTRPSYESSSAFRKKCNDRYQPRILK
jgi:hypothetical protein